jgi:tetratricopeptide (TPR) repeat protein
MTDEALLAELAEEFTDRIRAGEPVDILEEYGRSHPGLAERIRELFPMLALLEGTTGAPAPTESGLPPGHGFGRYRIEREIGRGGMGVVYRAVHLPLGKRVALKLLPSLGAAEPGKVERFLREARTGAALHHTNIVPVFDVGRVGDTPYYAMELIEGRGLDRVLLEQRASAATLTADHARWVAGLGVQAGEALEYAHRRGVIHRDIKPSNLLLDAQGILWVADFGLARRLDDPALTRSGALLGTPRYMSPEQAGGGPAPVDHRTDLYSLGATLYEALTRRPVFDGKTPEEVVGQILTRTPEPPRRLDPAVPRDLENVVLKAMARRAEDRYATAADLVEDLRRWLRHEPVRARAAGPLLRLRRWGERNPALAAAVAGLFLVLVTGLAVSLHFLVQARDAQKLAERNERRAEWNFGKLSEAVEVMLTKVGQVHLADVPQMELVRREVLEEALRFHEGLLRQGSADAGARRETAVAHRLVADLHRMLGHPDAAEREYRAADALLEGLAAEAPGDRGLRLARSVCQQNLGGARAGLGRKTEAVAAHRRSIELLDAIAEERDPERSAALAARLSNLAALLQEMSLGAEARGCLARAGALRDALADAPLRGLGFESRVALVLPNVASLLHAHGRLEDAERAHRRDLAACEALVAEFPERPLGRDLLARTRHNLGLLLARTGRYPEAVQELERAGEVEAALVADFPATPAYRSLQAETDEGLGVALQGIGRDRDAEAALRRAIAIRERLAADFAKKPEHRLALARGRTNLGMLLRRGGRAGDARECHRRALAMLERLIEETPDDPSARKQAAVTLHQVALLERDRGALPAASDLFERADAHLRAVRSRSPDDPEGVEYLAINLLAWAETSLALRRVEAAARAADELAGLFPDDPRRLFRSAALFARCHALAPAAGPPRPSRAWADRALALLREAVARGFSDLAALRESPDLDVLRPEVEFQLLLRKLSPARR